MMRQPHLLHHLGRVLIGGVLKQENYLLVHQRLDDLVEGRDAEQVAHLGKRQGFAVFHGAQRVHNQLFLGGERVLIFLPRKPRVQLNARFRAELERRRQGRVNHLADGAEVVVGHPAEQLELRLGHDGRVVDKFEDVLGLIVLGRGFVHGRHNAAERLFSPELHNDAAANHHVVVQLKRHPVGVEPGQGQG